MKHYAGIGSRKTPTDVLILMTEIAKYMETRGFILRSGGAKGADSAFEAGTTNFESWNPRKSIVTEHDWARRAASDVCWEFPLEHMKPFVQNLIIRNMYQVLGENGDKPCSYVILWTPNIDACHKDSGGTRYAARLANQYKIPISQLNNPQVRQKWEKLLGL